MEQKAYYASPLRTAVQKIFPPKPPLNYPAFSATDGSFLLGQVPQRPEAYQVQGPDYAALLKEAEQVFNSQRRSAAAPVRKQLPAPDFAKSDAALEKLAPRETDYVQPVEKGDTLKAVLQNAALASVQGGGDLGRTLALAGGAALQAKQGIKDKQREQRLDYVQAEQRFLDTKFRATLAQEEAVREMVVANNQIDFQNAQAKHAAAQSAIDAAGRAKMQLLNLKFDVAGKQADLSNTNAELRYKDQMEARQERAPKIAGENIIQQQADGRVTATPFNQTRAQKEADFVKKAVEANPTTANFAPYAAKYQGRTPEANKAILVEAIINKGLADEVFGRSVGEFITGKGEDIYGRALASVRKDLRKLAKLNGVPNEDFSGVYAEQQKDLLVQMLAPYLDETRLARLQKFQSDPEIQYGLRAVNGGP